MTAKARDREQALDPEISKPKEKHRHKRSRRRSSTKDPDRASPTQERRSSHASSVKRAASMTVPELDKLATSDSPYGSRASLPYPSFSKPHSKEAVGSRDNVTKHRLSYYTPDPTDLARSHAESVAPEQQNTTGVAPPSPPLTTVEPAKREDETASTPSASKEEKKSVSTAPSSKEDKRSGTSVSAGKEEDKSRLESSLLKEGKKSAATPSVDRERRRTSSSKFKDDGKKARPTVAKDEGKRPSSATVEERPVKPERKKTDLQTKAEEIKRKLLRKSSIVKPSAVFEQKSERSATVSKSKGSQREISKDKTQPPVKEAKDLHLEENSKPRTPSKPKPGLASVEDATSSIASGKDPSHVSSSNADNETTSVSTIDSDATSIAPNQPKPRPPSVSARDSTSSSMTDPDSSPRTPTYSEPSFPHSRKKTPALAMRKDYSIPGPFDSSPAPPPPPPPPAVPFQIPRVDYLMQNGGLNHAVPKTLLAAGQSVHASQSLPASALVEKFFAPFHGLLDDYTKVISRSGSLAVATGYRSIARRLLDRLEAVFARDISSETCTCIMCQSSPLTDMSNDDVHGINWGEVLEYVSGRQELPSWPPFVYGSEQGGLGISSIGSPTPMQNLDIDVPEEFREHYVQQSKETKQSVDRWLASQPDGPISAPDDVDDETLTFAMLTRLDPDQRPLFFSLVGVAPQSRVPSRAGTPLMKPRSSLLEQTGLAIQRLYRLDTTPRDAESAIYLLTNPSLHDVLATLAAICDDEWEILTSGRFDGFLRSGAEDHTNTVPSSRAPSRGLTPSARMAPFGSLRGPGSFSQSTITTPVSTPAPASVGAPVALDEETEIAVLAEVEREIYLGMEALEDAFEALHGKAEIVRRTLRERGAGLSMAWQLRRGSGCLDARLGTPAEGYGGGGFHVWESGTDDGLEDTWSELAPDDSASSVSRSRNSRPRRRTERRTPAPVEEEDEDGLSVG